MEIDKKLLYALLEASLAADYTSVRRAGSEIAKLLADAGAVDDANRVRALMRRKGVPLQASGQTEALPVDAGSRLPLVEEQDWPVTPLFADEIVRATVHRFLEDGRNAKLLAEQGLSPRLCLMLSGAPGTGKSLLAGHIASQLRKPFYVARLDSLISSRLGETAKNIRGIFDYVPARGAVLFLDEMDAIAKLRDDRHELGELKRVVNTVIQGLDSLDGESVVIGATNHPHLLDPAIWRRFPYKIDLGLPEEAVRKELWRHFLYADQKNKDSDVAILAAVSAGLSGADIENVALTARRQNVLEGQPIDPAAIAWAIRSSERGQSQQPPSSPLSPEQRRELARRLSGIEHLRRNAIAEFLGVSRQMLLRYGKGEGNGG